MKLNLKVNREKRIYLRGYFEDSDFLTVKYINREIWNYVNKLTVKTEDGLIYSEMQKIKTGESESKYVQAVGKIPLSELEKAREVSKTVNKLLIEYGLDSDNHTFEDETGKIKLNYDVMNIIGGKISSKTGVDFFTFVLNEIRAFNQGYELGE